MYPTGVCSPKFYGLPKIHKKESTVSSRALTTYGVAKVIAVILKPFVGRSKYHIHNTEHFTEQIKDITQGPGKCITSYDITTLFTSVAVATALKVVHNMLEQDHELHCRTKLTIQSIIELLWFCLHTTILSSKVSIMNRGWVWQYNPQ